MADPSSNSDATPGQNPPEHLSMDLMVQYLDALLGGMVPPETQKREIHFALLHAIASSDTFLQQKASTVMRRMSVMERWKLARLIDDIAAPARPVVKEKFAAFVVGMLPDDFIDASRREYASGTRLFAAGDDADEAMLVESGSVLISRSGRKIATLGPREFFGNLPFLIPVKRTADAYAIAPTTIRVLPRVEYLIKFATYSPHRRQDEFLLAYTMVRQLIGGMAAYDRAVKVLVDHLFPSASRSEQADILLRWMDHFTSADCFGPSNIHVLFNLLESLDHELSLLSHLDSADPPVLAKVQAGKGILRALAATHVRSSYPPERVMENPPKHHRLVNDLTSILQPQQQTVEAMLLPDFLWPTDGNRQATISLATAGKIASMMSQEGLVYFAGQTASPNLHALRQVGFQIRELAPGLHVASLTGHFGSLAAPQEPGPASAPASSGSLRQRLGRFWRGR